MPDSRTPESDQGAILTDEQEMVRKFLDTLEPRERMIIEERFGFNGNTTHTLEEVGRHHEVTRERIRQLQDKALRKMGRRMRHANPFQANSTPESPLESTKIAVFLDTLDQRDLTPQEKRMVASWCGL